MLFFCMYFFLVFDFCLHVKILNGQEEMFDCSWCGQFHEYAVIIH